MPTATESRLTELKAALKAKLDENEQIIESDKIKMEDGGVVVAAEVRDTYRKNLKDAAEIKSLMDEINGTAELKSFLNAPEGNPAAVAAAAAAAAAGGSAGRLSAKSLGEMFIESDEFQAFRKMGGMTMPQAWVVDDLDLGSMWSPMNGSVQEKMLAKRLGVEVKDIYTALPSPGLAAPVGFTPVQYDPMIEMRFRTQRVRDLFPVQQTTAGVIEYFRVTGFTNNASVVPERAGGTYALKPQSFLNFAGAQAPVRTIAHWETAHRNTLDDVAQLQGVVNNELLYGLRLAEDNQILNGTGAGEDLLGILNTPGIQGLVRGGADNFADAIRRAATRSYLAYYEPTGVVVHPIDWEGIELLKATTGQYLLATSIAAGGQKVLWRMPVVDTPAMPQGTALVGSFGLGATLYDRMQANIRIAEQHSDLFVRNAIAILAEERLALAVKRPESFVRVTF